MRDMPKRAPTIMPLAAKLSFVLIIVLLVVLWIAGGASRADVPGQVVTRSVAWAIAVVYILFVPQPRLQPVLPVALFVLAVTVLVALQLIPLPPSLWIELPSRDLLAQTALVSGLEQPWRPLSISPGATVNALSSLIVPIVMLFLMAGLPRTEQSRVAALLLGLVVASSLVGLFQFSGARFDNPLINDIPETVSASFANRNHFALFAAIGCLLAPVWGFRDESRSRWKGLTAIGLILFFALIILATGSRTGMVLCVVGIAYGLLIVRRNIKVQLKRLPKKVVMPLVLAPASLVVAAVILSITLGRAVSIDRALILEVNQDLRSQALPTVLEMTGKYFPFGSGFGTFDPAYRIDEPSRLLSTSYFNHAHNDLLEIVLDGGLISILLLASGVAWWLWKSVLAWKANSGSSHILARLGSGMLLLVLLASLTDYPARTPMIMAVIVIAGIWLTRTSSQSDAISLTLTNSER